MTKDPKQEVVALTYQDIRKIDVSEHIEKKNNLSYLSWAWAVDTLLLHDTDASWEYPEPTVFPDGTMMVYCVVKAFGKERKAHLPVMDYKNQAIKNPGAFQINTAMQRCLVKAIAHHGLGLYIYAGEDLPDGDGPVAKGNKRSGNKAVDKAVNEALGAISNAADEESAKTVGRYQWKFCKESGASDDQLALIQQQVENHTEYLRAKQ